MTNFPYDTVRLSKSDGGIFLWIYERRTFLGVVFAIAAVCLVQIASAFWDHPPDPSPCKPSDTVPPIFSQIPTPTVPQTCLTAGPTLHPH
jgi:hypothetical protein